jgi:hypothetical protein
MTPTTLAETVPALDALLSEEDRKVLQEAETAEQVRTVIVTAHHSFGRFLRNKWSLGGDSPLAQDLKKNHGVHHPDNMSAFILDHYSHAKIRTRAQRLDDDDSV